MRNLPTSVLVGAICVIEGVTAWGQIPVQQGGLMDANTRLGSGRYNGPGRDYAGNINSTQRLITGNSAGATAFRGFSPIRNPNTFGLGTPIYGGNITTNRVTGLLPSDSLSPFQRDATNVSSLRQMQGISSLAAVPYYAPGSTVLNTGQIAQGLNQQGTSMVRNPYESLRVDYRPRLQNPVEQAAKAGTLGNLSMVQPNVLRAATGSLTGSSAVNERLLSSTLFTGVRQMSLSQLAAETGEIAPGAGRTTRTVTGEVTTIPRGAQNTGAAVQREGNPLDRLLGGGQGATGANPAANAQQPAGPVLRKQIGAAEPEAKGPGGTLAARVGPLQKPLETPSGRTGWSAMPVGEEPIRTFTGTTDQRFNEQLSRAEALLSEQRYYDAASRYEIAHAIQLDNPAPLFGRSMALLAAGDYVASSNDLFMGIQLAGAGGAARIDLKRFVPDLKLLDRHRAFLEQRLEQSDDFRLRFLLGWAEYMSDLPEPGLANMTAAAKSSPPEMRAVREYVDRLKLQSVNTKAATATRPE